MRDFMELPKQSLPMEQLMQLLDVQLRTGGKAYLTVTGNSMRPVLRNLTDRVELTPVTELKSGDIILYQRENEQYVLHRILRILPDGSYLCCGDNQWETEIIRREQILAVVSGFSRGKQTYDVRHPGYRAYVRTWVALHPIRRPLLAVRRHLGRLRTALKNQTESRK